MARWAARLLLLAAGLGLLPAASATAQDGAAPGAGAASRPPLLLNLIARPTETAERAMQEAVRDDARAARPAGAAEVEVLPDGSVRIGRTRVTVTVTDACPEETHNVDVGPRPLPGRARR